MRGEKRRQSELTDAGTCAVIYFFRHADRSCSLTTRRRTFSRSPQVFSTLRPWTLTHTISCFHFRGLLTTLAAQGVRRRMVSANDIKSSRSCVLEIYPSPPLKHFCDSHRACIEKYPSFVGILRRSEGWGFCQRCNLYHSSRFRFPLNAHVLDIPMPRQQHSGLVIRGY